MDMEAKIIIEEANCGKCKWYCRLCFTDPKTIELKVSKQDQIRLLEQSQRIVEGALE